MSEDQKPWKPSKAQLRVLQLMASGSKLYILRQGYRAWACLSNEIAGQRRPNVQTVQILEKKGLIEDTSDAEWRWRGSDYAITDAGRKVVEEAA